MQKRITIKDIAKELNVHHSTVSRALRNDPRVNESTRDLVLACAQKHEYQTNMNAVQLRGTSNNTIALIVPNINHSFFSDIVSQLTNLAYKKGYIISVFQSNENYEQEVGIVNTIIKQNYAGVITSISKNTTDSKHFNLLKTFGIPLVFFDRVCNDIITPKVLVNNYEVTFQATEYLIEKGYRNIAHLTGPAHINVFNDRQNGYLDAILKHKLIFKKQIIINEDFSVEIGKQILVELMSGLKKPDAIISSSNLLALGLAVQAREMSLSIPRDLGLIAFGDPLSAMIMQPQMTTISQPESEIAALAFDLLEKMINKEIHIGQEYTETVNATIEYRESC
ncbi:MAG: LacI family DNA-binding transcriptional regulator [Paludibacter sp.]|nr:LacI family DNA-binding transcriptional regulator [Paludibacter sp.]